MRGTATPEPRHAADSVKASAHPWERWAYRHPLGIATAGTSSQRFRGGWLVLTGKPRAGRLILCGVGGAWAWLLEVGSHFDHQPQSSC